MAYRVIIWGLGKYLENELEKKIIDEINKENIEVVAEIDKNISKHVFCDSQIYPSEIKKNYYDYLIITSENNSAEITEEALKAGVERERIIYGKLLMDNGFDFLTYKEKGWLNNRIFNDTICVTDYTDDLRVLKGKKIKVSLGRKSSIGLTRLVTGGNPNVFLVTIGNFTNISWDGVFELGLNLDHNYKRVLNYGLTHLLDDYSIPDDKPEKLII